MVENAGDASVTTGEADNSTVASFIYPSPSVGGPAANCPKRVGYDKTTGGFEGVMNPSPLAPSSGEALGVGSFFILEECSGLGGQHVVGKDLYSGRTYWFGGHGCTEIANSRAFTAKFAVFRYAQTAAIFQPENPQWCIEFPDKSKVSTDAKLLGIATFETQALAERYATALGWKRP